MDNGWILAYSSSSPISAELLRQALEEEGITAVIINQHDSSFTSFGDAEVYVEEAYVEQAKKKVEDFEN